jgi:hypothetical protein
MASISTRPEQETILRALGVTYEQFVFYESGRISGRYVCTPRLTFMAVTTRLTFIYLFSLLTLLRSF